MKKIDILYQDNYLLVVNKPSGVLSIKGSSPEKGESLIEILKKDYPTALIVHRLDMDTSGIMVIALNKQVQRDLSKQFELRQISKRYEAVVSGIIKNNNGKINIPLAKDVKNPPRQKIDEANGKCAKTIYKVLKYGDNMTKVGLKPITGRSHQLRVHMLHIGHPILGDSLYANDYDFNRAPRLQLHACMLSFTHPITKKIIKTQCNCNLII